MTKLIVCPYTLEEKFIPHFFHNQTMIKAEHHWGGGTCIRHLLGGKLDSKLWENLTERLHIVAIEIFRPGDEQKTFNIRWGRTATIYLDENYLVEDIRLEG